jgi:hypothetical protein
MLLNFIYTWQTAEYLEVGRDSKIIVTVIILFLPEPGVVSVHLSLTRVTEE